MSEIELVKSFLLVMVRFTGLILTAPVLSSRNFPMPAKAGLAGMSALIVTPLLPPPATPWPEEALPFAVLAAQEALVGALMGFVMTLMFAAIQVAGEIMDTLTGFSVVNVFNPALETQAPVFGFFYFLVAMLYLLTLNGHHLMLTALVSSFDKIPLGGLELRPELLREQAELWGRAMFVDGLMIAAPVAGSLLLAYLTMGLLGRVVPQIHLFVVGFPITIAIGLTVAALSIHLYLGFLNGMFYRMFENVSSVINGMG